MMMLADKNHCSGCGACAARCLHQAIVMMRDSEGFAYPTVIGRHCVDCGACRHVCPVLNPAPTREPLAVYAARAVATDVRRNSSSGGLFALLAEKVLQTGGVVYGAAMSEDARRVVHIAVRNSDELPRLMGSKYVQSDMSGTYAALRADVQTTVPILFSGTPCQVAAVRAFLGPQAARVLWVEVICHAVPSPLAWNAYVDEQEQLERGRLVRVEFRNKQFGWKRFGLRLIFANGVDRVLPLEEDPFLRAFLNELCNRPSCHQCSVRSFRSGADITLGDYWKMEGAFPGAADDGGLSVILLNTIQGQAAFTAIHDGLCVWNSNLSDAVRVNPPLVRCSVPHAKRGWFFRQLAHSSRPFSSLVGQAFQPSLGRRLRITLGRWRQRLLKF